MKLRERQIKSVESGPGNLSSLTLTGTPSPLDVSTPPAVFNTAPQKRDLRRSAREAGNSVNQLRTQYHSDFSGGHPRGGFWAWLNDLLS